MNEVSHASGGRRSGPIRVLHVLATSDVGGTEAMTSALVCGLDPAHVVCEVCFLDGTGPVAGSLQAMDVPTHHLGGRGGYAGVFWRLRRLLSVRRFDIVQLYGFRMSLLGRIAARTIRPRAAVIHGIRGLTLTDRLGYAGLIATTALLVERLGSSLVDAYVSNSFGVAESLSRRGLPKTKFVVIPNGIDAGRWTSDRGRGPRRSPQIVCVANFRPVKRHTDLIDALALLKSRRIDVECLLVGDGPLHPKIRALVRKRRLEDRVRFMGRVEGSRLNALLGRADIFALPSLFEGLAVSIMEAMASGLPVVGTNVGGIKDLVVDGETGYLTTPGAPDELAERLAVLVANPHLRKRMGKRGQDRILRDFSLNAMIARYHELYGSMVPNGHAVDEARTGGL